MMPEQPQFASCPLISVVIPIYNNESFIEELIHRLSQSLTPISAHYELIFVHDGSPDASWAVITTAAEKDNRIKGIKLTRNFGQHMAISAGLAHSRGNWAVVMDGDLQDRPEEIPKLYEKAQEGFDVVFARRHDRKDSRTKRLFSRFFYLIFDRLAGSVSPSDPTVANFGIYSKKVVRAFNSISEHSRLFPLVIRWLGFTPAYIDVEHAPRSQGNSAYTFRKRFNLALDSMIAMSNQPLKLFVKGGFLLSFLATLYGIYVIAKYFLWGVPVQGWTSLMVSIYFLGGLLLASMGILGLYIGKTYDEAKNRPLFVIDTTVNMGEEDDPLHLR